MPTAYETAFQALSVEQRSDKATRYSLIAKYSFSIPTDADVANLAALAGPGGFVEIGAGWGYWSKLLVEAGEQVVTTDILPPPPAGPWSFVFPHDNPPTVAEGAFPSGYWVEEVLEKTATAAVAGQGIPGNARRRTVVAVQASYSGAWVASYTGDRVVLIQDGPRGNPDGFYLNESALLAAGFTVNTGLSYDKALFWPGYPDRFEVWER